MARLRTPVLAWMAVGLVLVVVQYWANARLAPGPVDLTPTLDRFFAGWRQFDAGEFIAIADDGYWYVPGARSPTSFFPLYPLLVRAVSVVAPSTLVAAVAVSAAAGLAVAVGFWRWCARWGLAPATRTLALAVLLVYPWAWFLYGVPFSDALFVALVIGAFTLVEDERYGWAAVVGALATATRPTGMFLAPALVLLALERAGALRSVRAEAPAGWIARLELPTRWHRERFRPALLVPALALVGIGAYSLYLGVRFGAPFTYITDQRLYNGSGPKTWFKAGLVEGWITWDDPWRTFAQTVEALVAVGVLVAVPSVGRRFGWGYGLFVLALVAMPAIATRDFNSTGRYLLAAFPVVVVLAERLAARHVAWRVGWLVCSAALLVVLDAAFARSQMVS